MGTPRGGRLVDTLDELTMPRIGREVDATGSLSSASLDAVCADVRALAIMARDRGADPLLFCATAAVRRAGNRAAIIEGLGEAAGVPCRLITPQAEARLSFRGAISEHGGQGPQLVADIGGGSTECILGAAGRVSALVSLPVGSGSATERWLHDDPATTAQRAACAAALQSLFADTPHGHPERGICTGGTVTVLPLLLGGQPSGTLDADDLARCRHVLDKRPSAVLAESLGMDPARCRVLAGGVEIVDSVRRRYQLPSVTVSLAGLRHGMILAYLEKGDRWPEG